MHAERSNYTEMSFSTGTSPKLHNFKIVLVKKISLEFLRRISSVLKENFVKHLSWSFFIETIKDALSSLRQLLATESPLKVTKNSFYFTSKALFVLKIYKFLS